MIFFVNAVGGRAVASDLRPAGHVQPADGLGGQVGAAGKGRQAALLRHQVPQGDAAQVSKW